MILAGVSRTDITPRVDGIPVHDPLEAKALVIRDGATAIAIMSCDVRSIRWDFQDRLRREAARRMGIPREHVAVHCTHNHSNLAVWRSHFNNVRPGARWEPPVLDELLEQMLHCFDAAAADMKEVVVSSAAGTADGIAASACVRLRDGRAHWVKGNSPFPWRDEIVGRGPCDPSVQVMRLTQPNAAHLAHIVNFACHPTADIGGSEGIGGDYPAYAMRSLERRYGGVALFLNGPCGDIHPADYMTRRGVEFAQDLGATLADSVVALEGRFDKDQEAELGAVHVPLALPRRKRDTAAELDPLLKQRRQLLDELSVRVGPALSFEHFLRLYQHPAGHAPREADRVDDYLRLVRTMERICSNAVDLATVKGMPPNGLDPMLPVGSDGENIAVELQAFRVGSMAFVMLPGEPFAQTSLDIKAASPFAKTAVVELTNASIGYVPTSDVFEHFVYPVQYSVVAQSAADLIAERAAEALRALWRR